MRLDIPSKALSPILVTDSGITVLRHPTIKAFVSLFMTALQLSLQSYTRFPFSTIIDFILSQPENAPASILLTDFGILTEERPEQPQKASSFMVITLFGIVTEVISSQDPKANSPMVVTFRVLLS